MRDKDTSALRGIFQYSSLAEKPFNQWEITTHWRPHHCDRHLDQTKLNDLLPLTIDGVLDRTEGLPIEQNSCIMPYIWWVNISWHLVKEMKNIIYVAKTRNYDYVLIDRFWGSAGFLDSPTSYVTLVTIAKEDKKTLKKGVDKDFIRFT